MTRFLKIAILALVGLMLFVGPACAGYDHYTINVYKDVGYRSGSFGYPAVTSGVQYLVLTAATGGLEGASLTKSTLYGERGLTSMSNPVNFDTFDAVGKIEFWIADSETSCDIIVVDNDGGYTLYLNNVTPSVHSAIIDERMGVQHHGQIWFSLATDVIWSGVSTAAPDAAHTLTGPFDTGIDFHVNTMISDVLVEMIVPCYDSSDTDISVGFASAENAFRNLSETDAHGFVDAIWSASCTHGELLYMASCVEAHGGGVGTDIPASYILREAGSLTYQLSSGDNTQTDYTDAGWGFLHFFFTPLRR